MVLEALFLRTTTMAVHEVATGPFRCPACGSDTSFSYRRRVEEKSGVILFWPYKEETVVGEFVVCASCGESMEASVLLEAATPQAYPEGVPLRNVVSLSPAAADEIRARLDAGDFGDSTYVRVIPHPTGGEATILFDLPYADDHEWLGRSRGLSVVVDRALADSVQGMEVDFDGERFTVGTVPRR